MNTGVCKKDFFYRPLHFCKLLIANETSLSINLQAIKIHGMLGVPRFISNPINGSILINWRPAWIHTRRIGK